MSEFWQGLLRRLRGERRHAPRVNAEKQQIIKRQWNAAVRLAQTTGDTPESLLDYKRADTILARRES